MPDERPPPGPWSSCVTEVTTVTKQLSLCLGLGHGWPRPPRKLGLPVP